MLSPEAEVTRSLSSNLLKRGNTLLQTEEKRIIDSNELVARRIQNFYTVSNMGETDTDGFRQGLYADDVTDLLSEEQETEEEDVYTGPGPEELLEEAREEIERMRLEASALLEEERRRVLEDAKNQGYQEGYDKGCREADRMKSELKAEKHRMEEEFRQLNDTLEPEFIDTLTGIYEHIFKVELGSYRELIIHLINSTMRNAESSRNFLIHVSKEDYPYVSMQKKQLMAGAVSAGTAVEIIEDIAMGRNDCLIEADGGLFDCGLGTQLQELGQKLKLLSYARAK